MKYFTNNILTIIYLILAVNTLSYAQVGYYEFEGKEKLTVESIELFSNGSFEYINKGTWATSKTLGRWKMNGSNIALNSEYKVDSFRVIENNNPKVAEGKIYLVFNASAYNQGPRAYRSIILNENASLSCTMMQDKILAEAEARNKILTRGTRAERDSIGKSYSPVYFECKAEGVESLQTVTVEFDKHRVIYTPINPSCNELVFSFNLAPDSGYRYFNNEVFLYDKKSLASGTDKKFKKTKK
jgi:hypothetical protein